jgi:16S rRNA (uracil1498-N3)-methyltransferase
MSLPRFFLAAPPEAGRIELLAGEAEHALKVLRMRQGDACEGVDGAGHCWPLRVARVTARSIELEPCGSVRTTPPAGEPGAPLPWIELAVAWPRKNLGERMIGSLVQLGVAAITPLEARQGGPAPCPREAPERWAKLAREACKQSRRSWLPVFHERASVAGLAERLQAPGCCVLDPQAAPTLVEWLGELDRTITGFGTETHPVQLVVGPEGGLHDEELAVLRERGAAFARLAPHVLRIETAARAAAAIAACALM